MLLLCLRLELGKEVLLELVQLLQKMWNRILSLEEFQLNLLESALTWVNLYNVRHLRFIPFRFR